MEDVMVNFISFEWGWKVVIGVCGEEKIDGGGS